MDEPGLMETQTITNSSCITENFTLRNIMGLKPCAVKPQSYTVNINRATFYHRYVKYDKL
jgi:hypothetical protein